MLHRHHRHADVVAGITAVLPVGAVSPDVVAVLTRKHAQQQANPAVPDDQVAVSLNQRRLAEITGQLREDLRPAPSVVSFDALLTGTRDP